MGLKICGKIVINLIISFNTLTGKDLQPVPTRGLQPTDIRCWLSSLMMRCQASTFVAYLCIFSRWLTLTHTLCLPPGGCSDLNKTVVEGVFLPQGKNSLSPTTVVPELFSLIFQQRQSVTWPLSN